MSPSLLQLAFLAAVLTLVRSAPSQDSRPEIIEIIAPAAAAQETLESLNLGSPNAEQSERSKRTIGILRQLFPTLSQIVDQKIQQIVSVLFRTIGRSVLTGVLGGGGGGAATTATDDGGRISVSLPAYTPDDDDDSDEDDEDSAPSGSQSSATTEATSGAEEDNSLAGAESQKTEVRVQFEDDKKEDDDQDSAASGGNDGAIDDLSLDDADADSSDENRNKRFLGLGGGSEGSSGSGGGSGNFLFDIIRLVAGSGGTEQSDEASSAPSEDAAKGDGYAEGIPGPVTRLFIIANRGIANLIQDLILRIAQTSERIVNFKARLITSII